MMPMMMLLRQNRALIAAAYDAKMITLSCCRYAEAADADYYCR